MTDIKYFQSPLKLASEIVLALILILDLIPKHNPNLNHTYYPNL